jgi:hypothetical protein
MPWPTLPAGIRLDNWPEKPATPPSDPPEVNELRAAFRTSHPQMATLVETLNQFRSTQELAAKLCGPQPMPMVVRTSLNE